MSATNDDLQAPMSPDETRTNLIVNHIPKNLTDEGFAEIFSPIGEIKTLRIMKNFQTGGSFGYGFVDYVKPEAAAKAILLLNNYSINNKYLKVSYANPPGQVPQKKDANVYIQNLPLTFTEEDLSGLFSPFGKLVHKLIYKDKTTGSPRGIAFVSYSQANEAHAAIQGMNGRSPQGCHKPLIVKLANDRSNSKNEFTPARGRSRGLYNNFGGNHIMNRGGEGDNFTPNLSSGNFGYQARKIGQGRMSNRYNPIGSGGGYGFEALDPLPPLMGRSDPHSRLGTLTGRPAPLMNRFSFNSSSTRYGSRF